MSKVMECSDFVGSRAWADDAAEVTMVSSAEFTTFLSLHDRRIEKTDISNLRQPSSDRSNDVRLHVKPRQYLRWT